VVAALLAPLALAAPQGLAEESDYYRIVTLRAPDDVVLEVGGIALLSDGRPLVCTRRGEVFVVENAYDPDGAARYTLFAEGLQEPLGLLVHQGWIYVAQRGEVSRMRDVDGDDRVDEIETVCDLWRVSGNYHEYLFGPRLGPGGELWITTNKPFGDEPFGQAHWRGFALRITPAGEMLPTCAGLRSPAGVETSPWGEVFYTDNQGEWCGASKLAHLEPGDFHGHPHGLFSCKEPQWTYGYPGDPKSGTLMPEVSKDIPSFKPPAVWFPYDKTGKSPAGMVWDTSDGGFGPFGGQLFVSDQHHAALFRVFLEEVNGHWQGAVFPFRYGFQCGVIRVAWGADGSLFAGETNRGWGGRGSRTHGLERLIWTGATPFEVREMRARPDGFELAFTEPVDLGAAAALESYRMESYTYLLHADYGSDEVEKRELAITAARPAADGSRVRLAVEGLRAGYVHELHLPGVKSRAGAPLLHEQAYYTLIEIPRE